MFWKKEKVIRVAGLEIREYMIHERIVQDVIWKKMCDLDKEIERVENRKATTIEAIRNSLRTLERLHKDSIALGDIYNG